MAVLATVSSARTSELTAAGHSMAVALTGGYELGFWISAVLVGLSVVVAAIVLHDPAEVPVEDPTWVHTAPN